ncbi:hypothetical protein EV702DRAFT_1049039 [Suillus placidus]|uniref:Uncharacterized protein n=1 Tax=Suillus placidus TaxID=48579 RepID=A0A9P6ZLF3_9AGAM|nr:hypothetical protein EV702DRAFT_1049039 [Suillus placidus]
MSTPVDTSLTGLKAPTAQIIAIITSTQQLPLGSSHFALRSQAHIVKEYKGGPLPGVMLSCFKELIQVQFMTAQIWPNWHSIEYDDPCLLKHIWHPNILAWEALGNHTFDLPVAAPPSTSLIPVTLPSPPVPASNIAGSSGNPSTKSWDKGKDKAVFADLDPKAEGSRKRKSPMTSEPSFKLLKLAMKIYKCLRLTHIVKSKPFIEPEDDDDDDDDDELIIKVLMKKPFSPAKVLRVIASSRLAVIKPVKPTPKPPAEVPQINIGSILIPRLCIHTLTQPTEQPMSGLQQARLALCNSVQQED